MVLPLERIPTSFEGFVLVTNYTDASRDFTGIGRSSESVNRLDVSVK